MRYVFLDAYGTLFRYEAALYRPVFAAIAQGQGLSGEPEALLDRSRCIGTKPPFGRGGSGVRRADGSPDESGFEDAFADPGLVADTRAAVAVLLEDLRSRETYPEVPGALAALRARVPLGLLSNADAAFLFGTLAHNGLRFDSVVYSEQERAYKPHPRIFQRALERVGAQPEEVLFAGDSPAEDMAGAAAAGIPAVWVNRRSEEWPLPEPPPVYEVRDLLGLVDVAASRIGVVY